MEQKNYKNDKEFLSNHLRLVELARDGKKVLLSQDLQGRVLTSTATGDEGDSFGWLNYDLIAMGKFLPHCNNFGGEDRYWLGPEGGQFSVFFCEGSDFSFDDWQVPSAIDTDSWNLFPVDSTKVKFSKSVKLHNWTGKDLLCRLDRSVELLDDDTIRKEIGIEIPKGVDYIVFKSENQLTNIGTFQWNESTGMLSIWILGQFIPSENNIVIIPYKKSDQAQINDSYFGKIDADRLTVTDNAIFFKGDGKNRGKIGIPPEMVVPFAGAYDSVNGILTIVHFNFPGSNEKYVNAMWEYQKEPFKGDVINSYNDGPLDDGSIMGPFYELETSSPAARLKVGESITHRHVTMHFKGNLESLNMLAMKYLETNLQDIEL
ncbi:DUF6786 family protein [Microbacter margulisiae]|uniref:Uncharacterized protein n=1 Tax=Microbacter margulisiae TaxID=1350067 RepID=A0A7W5DT36_9PORP|nr:DUF6786 family protein [Microbacter margulisiae]MBB3188258.1 hypothetical protein [Microbacter margulisiae]